MSMKKIQVSYVGVNNLFGRVASSLLQRTPGIKKLILYDDADIKRKHDAEETLVAELCGRNNLPEALESADVIILGDESEADVSATGNKLKSVAKRVCEYINTLGAVNKAKKPPIVVVASSPLNIIVPLAAEVLEKEHLYHPERLFGATSGDTFRSSVLLANHMRTQPGGVVIPVVGGSSYDTRVPLFSQMHPQAALSDDTRNKLIHETRILDQDPFNVTDVIERAYTTVRFLASIITSLQGKMSVPEISMISTNQHPDVRFLSVPVILGPRGVERIVRLPALTPFEEDMLDKSVQFMKEDARSARNLLKEIEAERKSSILRSDSNGPGKLETDVDLTDFDSKEYIGNEPLVVSRRSKSVNEMKQPTVHKITSEKSVQRRAKSETEGNTKGPEIGASDDHIVKRKRGRSLRRPKKRSSSVSASPQVALKCDQKSVDQSGDTRKSKATEETVNPPQKTAGEKISELNCSIKTQSPNETRQENSIQAKKTDSEAEPKTNLAQIEPPKAPVRKMKITPELELPGLKSKEGSPGKPKLDVPEMNSIPESQIDACAAEKSRRVTSYSYSAFVDSPSQPVRSAIEPRARIAAFESPLRESAHENQQSPVDERRRGVKCLKSSAQTKPVRKQSKMATVSGASERQKSPTRSVEPKKWQRLWQFSGIFEEAVQKVSKESEARDSRCDKKAKELARLDVPKQHNGPQEVGCSKKEGSSVENKLERDLKPSTQPNDVEAKEHKTGVSSNELIVSNPKNGESRDKTESKPLETPTDPLLKLKTSVISSENVQIAGVKSETPSSKLAMNQSNKRPEDTMTKTLSPKNNEEEDHRHAKKSSAYIKAALQKISSASLLPELNEEEVGSRPTGITAPKKTDTVSHPKKNPRDQPAKSLASQRVTGEFKPSLITSDLTSDKGKHEAPHVVNFKVQSVPAAQPDAPPSNERDQTCKPVKNLVNQKSVAVRRKTPTVETTSRHRKKPNYLDNLKPHNSQTFEAITNESKWGKVFYVFRQALKNDLKREEERKLKKKKTALPGLTGKFDKERRRPSKTTSDKRKKSDGPAPVMVNVCSETFKPGRSHVVGRSSKSCPTKLKAYFNRRENVSPSHSRRNSES